jgi:hypothetical protein
MSFSFEQLLDATLDDIADLPEFKLFPAGAYQATLKIEEKQVNEHSIAECAFTLTEVMELSEPTDEAPALGSVATVGFMLNNEYGLGNFKKVLSSLKDGLNLSDTASLGAIIEAAQGAEVVVVLGQRKDKKDATRVYQQLVQVSVV